MSKVLITADVHIHDFRTYNLFNNPTFRLNQFRKLAERINDISKQVKAEALIIAGDFLHVANPRPYIVNTAFDFLDLVSERMDIYLTHGQHDYDSRTVMEGQHTLLSLCDRILKVNYIHKDIRNIGGKEFYFLGWEPEWSKVVSKIPKCDVLIGHAQPRDVKVGQRGIHMYGGEKIPDTGKKFSLAFLGDIHYHQSRDGWVIPGTPIQHSFNDHYEVGVICLDTDTMEWEHIPTIVSGKWDFLQLIITDEPNSDPYVVARPITTTETTKFQTKVERSLDTMSVIQKEVEESGLESLHTELLGSVCKDIRNEVNLSFTLESLKIENFRSISMLEWENINDGVKLISGRNGTGKSSLVRAIMFALTGEGSARGLSQNSKKQMSVEITLIYGRFRHTIRRGWKSAGGGSLQYYINGKEIPAENQRALTQKINENLPFLKFSDLLYHDQDRTGFLSSYNYAARVDLISRVLGLKIVDELKKSALEKLVSVDSEILKLREKLASATSIVDQENLVDFSNMEMVDENTEKNLQELKKAIETMLEKEKEKYLKSIRKEATITSGIKRATDSINESESRKKSLERQTCYTCGQPLNEQEYKKILCQINSEIKQFKKEITTYKKEKSNITIDDTMIKNIEGKLSSVSSQLSEVVFNKNQYNNLKKLKKSIDNAKKECIMLHDNLEGVEQIKEDLLNYCRLMDSNGSVMRSLLTSVSELLTSDTIRVRAHKQLVNGELRPDFGVDMKIPNQGWVSYNELSGGQKTVSDLTILEKLIKLVGGVGMLIFDETFKFLDNENLEIVVDVIKSIQCGSAFIISHEEGFPYWDLSIQTKVDNSGHTKYTMR